jgi:hypothetical protein
LATILGTHFRLNDLVTGREAPDLGERLAFRQAVWSPDGSIAALRTSDGALLLWEPGGGAPRRLVPPEDAAFLTAFSGDGKLLASGGKQGEFRLHSVTGEEIRTVRLEGKASVPLAFAPDGRFLVVGTDAGMVLVDPLTGKERLVLEGADHWAPLPVLTPDGRRLIMARGDLTLQSWDSGTGKVRRSLSLETEAKTLAVSPDGAVAAVGDKEGVLRFYHLGSGKVLHWHRIEGGVACLAYSPGGKLLACGGNFGSVLLLDPGSGRERGRLDAHGALVSAVAFSPDGKFLLTASDDTTALVWDVSAVLDLPAPPPPRARTLDELWTDLASADDGRADAAVRTLAERSGEALPLLQARLRPVPPVEAATIARLLADLDSEQFETRERAVKELQALDRLAEAPLRRLLAGQPPPGVRRAAQGLLDRLDGPLADADWLRTLRAVETLETIGTPEARRLLDDLTAGAPGARLTEEARAAALRLRRRAAARW